MNNEDNLTDFRTAIEGLEVTARVEYFEAFDDYDGHFQHDCNVEKIIFAGADIYPLCSHYVIDTIRRRFLESKSEEFEQQKAEQQIAKWESKQ